MLTSLIAVLVLLVIGFYAATIAAVGRAGVGEAQLPRSRRLALALAGVSALGLAYAIYRHPIGSGDPLTQASAGNWTAPAAPLPKDGQLAAEMAADRPTPELPAPEPAPVSEPAAQPAAAAPAAVSEPSAVAVAEPPVEAPRSIPPAEPAASPELSASAAAMEAELLRRRQGLTTLPGEPEPAAFAAPEPAVRAASATPVVTASAPAPAVKMTPAAPASAPRAAPKAAAPVVARSRSPGVAPLGYAPLTILVQNQLGAVQQSERLALLIEGKRVASFEITEAAPSISLPIRLPRPGLLHYRIEGESIQGQRIGLQGEGCIRVVEGARFQVRRRGSDSRQVFLETVNG
ncbi:hypothetical protein ED208_15585 [Stagnimonas aquatica]|uniref:Uncharacterized protein n=1 Tax=Stagnimonas aquatica TaxID=2689987 RepID=A0A3N0V0Y7_9GAMM|nr:hypothetical protein [Stagnimonas aquatica]ROH86457.1 hypothetical protein ED208_15585 [Stagnimonas aquatica]